MKSKTLVSKVGYLALGLLMVYMGATVTAGGISRANWVVVGGLLVAAGLTAIALWPKSKRNIFNRRLWYPSETTQNGVWLRAGAYSAIAIMLASAAMALWSDFNPGHNLVVVMNVMLLLHLPHSYRALRRQYELVLAQDEVLRHVGRSQVSLWVRLLIPALVALAVGIRLVAA